MKIIDERGMVFGKINIIDLMVVIFLLVLLVYLGSAIYFITCKSIPKKAEYERQIKVWEEKLNKEIAQKEAVFKKYPRLRKYFR